MTRIGPKMSAVVSFVAANPGEITRRCVEHVGPNGRNRYGYAIVGRAIAAGLVRCEVDPDHRGTTRLYPV